MYSRYLIVIGCFCLLASCVVNRGYERPDIAIPEQYKEKSNKADHQDSLTHQPGSFFRNKLLLQLLDSAFKKNSNMLMAVQNIAIAESGLKSVKLNYLPELNARINGNYSRASDNSLIEPTQGNSVTKNFNLSAALTWNIDILGKIKAEKKEALMNLLQVKEVRKAVQTKLVADIARGYYNLLMLDEQLKVARRSEELSDSTLNMMRVQYRVGGADMLGIRQIEAQLYGNQILVSQIRQSISAQENALSVLCGRYAGSISRKWEDNDEFYAIPNGGYPAAILASRPDIRAAELSLQAANARVGIQQAAMYPAINISLEGGLNSLTTSNWFSIPASLFGTFTGGIVQPIFNKRKLKTQYEQALIEREKCVTQFRQAVLDAYSQVCDAMKNKEEIGQQLVLARKKEKVLEDNIHSEQILFATGMVTYLDIITVQSTYLEARLQTSRFYMENALSAIELYYALGGGWQ